MKWNKVSEKELPFGKEVIAFMGGVISYLIGKYWEKM